VFVIQRLSAGGPEPDGACWCSSTPPPVVRGEHHGGHPVLRVREEGPQGRGQGADHGEARWRTSSHAAAAPRVLTMELPRGPDQASSHIPVDHLTRRRCRNIHEVSPDQNPRGRPDVAAVSRRVVRKHLQAQLAIVRKRRITPDLGRGVHVIGDVQGRNILIARRPMIGPGTGSRAVGFSRRTARRTCTCAPRTRSLRPALEELTGPRLRK